MGRPDILKQLLITCEILGRELSDAAAEVMVEELAQYPEHEVLVALDACRKSLKGRLTLADVLERIPSSHPGVEEAWAIMSKALGNESITIVQTEEMLQAFAVANSLADDPIAARMAFKETYVRLVSEARNRRQPAAWSATLGWDAAGRQPVIEDALKRGRLTYQHAQRICPELPPLDGERLRLT